MKFEYQLTIRLPEELSKALKKASERAKRSMNSQVLSILEKELLKEEGATFASLASDLKNIAEKLESIDSKNI